MVGEEEWLHCLGEKRRVGWGQQLLLQHLLGRCEKGGFGPLTP